jgi:hypothetical protein
MGLEFQGSGAGIPIATPTPTDRRAFVERRRQNQWLQIGINPYTSRHITSDVVLLQMRLDGHR